jgi:phosphoenolpyruvate-protein kinase (PTS system EI component)
MRRFIGGAVAMLVLGGVFLLPARVVGQEAERSRTQGIKETDQFLSAGKSMTEAVGKARLQIQKTMDAYNTLVTQPSANMKSDYKKLMKNVDTMNERLTEARQKVDEMRTAADTYFTGRQTTLKTIQDPQLQERAKQRLSDNQKQFGDVLQSLREVGQALEPVRKDLADQITYLGSDLNPSAMASLKPNADKLNTRGKLVFEDTDKAVGKANAYFDGLRSAES